MLSEAGALIENFKKSAANTAWISGLILHGSHARGEADFFSDIDLIFVVDEVIDEREPSGRLLDLLRGIVGETVAELRLSHDKYVFYTKEGFQKVEVQITEFGNLHQFSRLIEESHVEHEKDMILHDRDGRVLEWINKVRSGMKTVDVEARIETEAQKFLYNYESFYPYFSRGDLYRAYFHYNLALQELARILYMIHGETKYLFAPANLTGRVLPLGMSIGFRKVTSTMDPLKMREQAKSMFALFLNVMDERNISGELSTECLRDFADYISRKYPQFHNLRDLGHIPGIKRGLYYRSRVMTKYDPKEVSDWLKENSVKTIIDTRSKADVKREPYSNEILKNVDYVQIPIDVKGRSSDIDQYKDLSGYRKLYIKTLKQDGQEIKKFLEVSSDKADKGVLTHCIGGKDRTGIVIAVLLKTLGIPTSDIIEDYMLSFSDTKKERIETVIQIIEEKGGIEKYLDEIGVETETRELLRKKLCESPSGT